MKTVLVFIIFLVCCFFEAPADYIFSTDTTLCKPDTVSMLQHERMREGSAPQYRVFVCDDTQGFAVVDFTVPQR